MTGPNTQDFPTAVEHIPAVIANGSSLSDPVDLGGFRLVGIVMPAAWTTADLTFQAADLAGTYKDLYDDCGNEMTVTAIAEQIIALVPSQWRGVRKVQVRSGTSTTPINQGAERTLELIVEPEH